MRHGTLRDRLLLGVNQIRILLTHTLQVFELFGEPRDLCINLVQAETVFGRWPLRDGWDRTRMGWFHVALGSTDSGETELCSELG